MHGNVHAPLSAATTSAPLQTSVYLVCQAGKLEVVQIDVGSRKLMKVVVRCLGATASVKHIHGGAEHFHHGCKLDPQKKSSVAKRAL